MAMQLSPERQKLIEQVLEYWYTVDFLAQGGLKTEETRKDREMWSLAMNRPIQFSILPRHEYLVENENILTKIHDVETLIKIRREMPDLVAGSSYMPKDPCHGKITVYLGAIDQAYLSIAIADELKCEPPLNPSSSKLAIAAIQLNEDGEYIKGTLSLSPIAWALGRIKARNDSESMYETLDPEAYKASSFELEPGKDQGLVSYQDLHEYTEKIIEKLINPVCADKEAAGLEDSIHFYYSVYRDEKEKARRETEDYFGLSMSFYAEDISRFRNAASKGVWFSNSMWEALADYICTPFDAAHGKVKEHIDLGKEALKDPEKRLIAKDCLKKILSIDSSPWGKWPSKYEPFFMQQVAVNLAINMKDPIFAVNGPPGTGKTTLLREIVAEHVVQRALIMSEYEKPDAMFEYKSVNIGHVQKYVYSFRPDMKDIKRYGIVVASSNNNAVENISKQLPLVDTLDKCLVGFGVEDVEKRFSLEHAPKESAVRKNFDKEGQPKEKVGFPDIYFSTYASDLLREPCWGLLSAPLGRRSNILSFHKKVLKQLKYDCYLQSSSGNRLEAYKQARKAFLDQYEIVRLLRESLKLITDPDYDSNAEQFMDLGGRSVCFTDQLFDDLASDHPDIRLKAQMSCVNTTKQYDAERIKLFRCALNLVKEFILSSTACKSNLELLGCAWGMETSENPFSGLEQPEKEAKLRECMTPLIQTLQLMVPVISTTFASAGRFFKYVNKAEALGTIIVDEAGQATPQMALSLFSKASRAFVVGDPSQIDPVVTDELAFLESTLDEEIGEAYSDRTISVQKIADYLSTYGSGQSDILGIDGKSWIGLPLYVHSRCIEPMFSISNRLSYGDTMLRITGEPGNEKQFCYNTSQWINVPGEAESDKNHFVQAQGERVLELLSKAFSFVAASGDEEQIQNGPDIFVISPFHTVAEGMRQMLVNALSDPLLIEKYPVFAQNKELVENWVTDDQNPHIGTVHTFQGREADEVILLLGCDVHSIRSANWVNRNIVNVAVSRARYRLYAVGDIKAWSGCSPVMEMKFDLDAHQFDKLAATVSAEPDHVDTDEDLFAIPELPTSEMFDISDIEDEEGEQEYLIDTDSGIENVRAAIPGLASDFTAEQLSWFGLSSMNEFEGLFDDKTKDLLRTGMWIYAWIKPSIDKLPEDYDASFVGICFCKAYEHSIKDMYFVGLQKLFPDEDVRGKAAGAITTEPIMIGDITTFISNRLAELASIMSQAGHPECGVSWWSSLSKRLRKCKDYRNKCAHPGEVFHWKELELLIEQLLLGVEDHGVQLPGLMVENTFRNAVVGDIGDAGLQDAQDAAQAVRDQQYEGSIVKYIPVYCKMHVCPEDNSSLVQELVEVTKKDGKNKKLNMLICRKCGRRFINIPALPVTVDLADYYLKAIKTEDWEVE